MTLRLRRGTDAQRLTITPSEGELIYVTDSKLLYVGDGITVGGILVGNFDNELTGDLNLNTFNIIGNGNINLTGNIDIDGNISSTGTITSTTAGLHIGDLKGSVFGDDSSLLVDGTNGNINANNLVVNQNAVVVGEIEASAFVGSVLSYDSSTIIDGFGSRIFATAMTANSLLCNEFIANSGGTGIGGITMISSNPTDRVRLTINSNDQSSTLNLRRSSASTVNPGTGPYYIDSASVGQINFETVDLNGTKGHVILQSSKNYFRILFLDAFNQVKEGSIFKITSDGNFGVGTNTPDYKLHVVGTAKITNDLLVSGNVEASSFIGSVFADDSTLVIDGLNGNVNASNLSVSGNAVISGTIEANAFVGSVLALDSTVLVDSSNKTINATNLTVSGNAVISGTIEAGSFVGSVFSDDSSVIVDSINKNISSISATIGNIVISNSEISTDDSSGIIVIQPTTFNSDVTIDNDLNVLNKIVVKTLEVENIITNSSGTPELQSDTDIILNAGTRVEILNSPFKLASFTTLERDALSAQNGDMIYNTDINKFQGYAGGSWVNLH